MRDFPSCFGENGIQVADSSSSSSAKNAQNLVTCTYQCKLKGRLCSISVTWTKNLMGQGLSIGIDDSTHQCLCKVDVKPWLFSKRKGSKTLDVDSTTRIEISWDLANAKFSHGPEPLGGFHLSVAFDGEAVLLLGGDPGRDPPRPRAPSPGAVLVARREHVFGKKIFRSAQARFRGEGPGHDVAIECDTAGPGDPGLVIRVDGKQAMAVKRLKWKFRGNDSILVDGLPVQVFWDVHDWLFGNSAGNAVFMFQTLLSGAGSVWDGQSVFDDQILLPRSTRECRDQGLGFSLILYAWKNE